MNRNRGDRIKLVTRHVVRIFRSAIEWIVRPKVRAICGIILNNDRHASNTLSGSIFVPFVVECVVVLLVTFRLNNISPNIRLRGFRDHVVFHRRFIQRLIIQCSPAFAHDNRHVRVIEHSAIRASILDKNFGVRVAVALITICRLICVMRVIAKKTVIQFTDNRTRS